MSTPRARRRAPERRGARAFVVRCAELLVWMLVMTPILLVTCGVFLGLVVGVLILIKG